MTKITKPESITKLTMKTKDVYGEVFEYSITCNFQYGTGRVVEQLKKLLIVAGYAQDDVNDWFNDE